MTTAPWQEEFALYAADSERGVFNVRSPCELEGRNTDTNVPLRPLESELRMLRLPSCLETIPCKTQSPSPFPFSALVVKNGSKILERAFLGMPYPESAIVRRTPFFACDSSQMNHALKRLGARPLALLPRRSTAGCR